MNALTVLIAGRCLIGPAFRRRISSAFARLYHDLEGGINLVAFMAPGAPTPANLRRNRARQQVAALLSGLIAERRRPDAAPEDDFMSALVAARYRDGSALSDDAVIGVLLTLLFAGQHTSAVMATWAGLLLQRFDFERADPVPRPDYATFVVGPELPCRVRYKRRVRPASAAAAHHAADLPAQQSWLADGFSLYAMGDRGYCDHVSPFEISLESFHIYVTQALCAALIAGTLRGARWRGVVIPLDAGRWRGSKPGYVRGGLVLAGVEPAAGAGGRTDSEPRPSHIFVPPFRQSTQSTISVATADQEDRADFQ